MASHYTSVSQPFNFAFGLRSRLAQSAKSQKAGIGISDCELRIAEFLEQRAMSKAQRRESSRRNRTRIQQTHQSRRLHRQSHTLLQQMDRKTSQPPPQQRHRNRDERKVIPDTELPFARTVRSLPAIPAKGLTKVLNEGVTMELKPV